MYKTAQSYKYNNSDLYNVQCGVTQKREGIFQEQPVHSLQLTEQQCKQLETFLLSQDKRAYTHAHYNYYYTDTWPRVDSCMMADDLQYTPGCVPDQSTDKSCVKLGI